MKHRILFVDDEEKILFSLKRIFRTENYECHYVNSGKEGLSFLAENPVSVIVSDMKMPVMNGVEFLQEAMKICPEATRLILSGYSDAGHIMEALNKGSIWHFISKPWNNDDLKITVKNAVDIYERNRERTELIEKLNSMNKLLENKVEERTRLIKYRSDLLNMLAEDRDSDKILKKTCSYISVILKSSIITVKILFADRTISSGTESDGNLYDLPKETEKKILTSGKPERVETGLAVPLEKGGSILGILFIRTEGGKDEETIDEISGFISILNITLFQYKTLATAPQLMENIDRLIGSM